jgi:hypothetical protein
MAVAVMMDQSSKQVSRDKYDVPSAGVSLLFFIFYFLFFFLLSFLLLVIYAWLSMTK